MYPKQTNLKLILLSFLFIAFQSNPVFSQSEASAEKNLLPTEALHRILGEVIAAPDKQGEIGKRVLQKVNTTDLSPEEQFALGEVYFVSLMGGQAKQVFSKFVKGDNLTARLARQRLMRMKFVIDEKIDEVEKEIYEYRTHLKPIKEDRGHTSGIVGSLARYYQAKADDEKAVKLIVEDVEAMPLDAPYQAFRLPATYFTSFVKAGKKDVALKLLEKAYEAVKKFNAKNKSAPVGSSGAQPITHRSGTFHRLEYRLTEDVSEETSTRFSAVQC